MELQHGVQHPGLAGIGSHFSGAFWFCKGMRKHCRTDVGAWKSQGDTVFYKAACVWIENPHNMDACQSGNVLEPVVRAASLCELLLSFMSGLKLGEGQVFKSKLERFLPCCHPAYWFVERVEQPVVSCGCSGLSHMVTCPHGSSQLWPGTSSLPLYHCTSSGKIVGSRAKASIQADSLLFSSTPKPTDRKTKERTPSLRAGVCALALHSCACTIVPLQVRPGGQLAPPQVAHPGHVDVQSWRAPGCLPLTASCQAPASHSAYKADAAMEPLGRLPRGCIIHHPAGAGCLLWALLSGLAAPWPPWKGCSTSPRAGVVSALLLPQFAMPWCQESPCCPIPHSTYPIKYSLVADLRELFYRARLEEAEGCG